MKQGGTIFWTGLGKMKRRLKASRKNYRTAGNYELRALRLNKYRQIKQAFEKELLESNKNTRKRFVDKNLGQDIWEMPYKLVTKKIRIKGTLITLNNDECNYT